MALLLCPTRARRAHGHCERSVTHTHTSSTVVCVHTQRTAFYQVLKKKDFLLLKLRDLLACLPRINGGRAANAIHVFVAKKCKNANTCTRLRGRLSFRSCTPFLDQVDMTLYRFPTDCVGSCSWGIQRRKVVKRCCTRKQQCISWGKRESLPFPLSHEVNVLSGIPDRLCHRFQLKSLRMDGGTLSSKIDRRTTACASLFRKLKKSLPGMRQQRTC